jgi:hypothetical protein
MRTYLPDNIVTLPLRNVHRVKLPDEICSGRGSWIRIRALRPHLTSVAGNSIFKGAIEHAGETC